MAAVMASTATALGPAPGRPGSCGDGDAAGSGILQRHGDALGEGEETLGELMDVLKAHPSTSQRSAQDALGSILGLAWPDGNGGERRNPRRPDITRLDDLPFPAWDLVDPMAYLAGSIFMGPTAGGRSIPMLATRGCPFRCTFCSSPNMWTQVWKARKPELVVDEMELWMKRYGADDILKAYLLLNNTNSQVNGACMQYDFRYNKLYLKNDAGTSWGIGYAPGSNVTLSNSQVFLDVKNTAIAVSGKNLVVKWRIKPRGTFPDTTLHGYQLVQDTGFLSTGWQLMGTY